MKRTTVSERVLVLAPRGRDAAIAAAILNEAGIEAEACASLPELVRELDRGAGMGVVTEEALATADLGPLAAWIGAQQEWSDLPFVLLTGHGGGVERNPAAQRYLDVLGNVTFLERPFHPTTLVSLAGSALRGRRRQYEARARMEALRESEARFRAAVGAVQGLVWTNDAQGRMTGDQPGWAALTGQSRDEYEGYGWASAVHPEDAQPTVDAWQEAVAGRRTFVFEHRVRRADGAWRRFSVRAVPTLDEEGRILEWVGIHTDITSERATALALTAETAALETLNRVGAAVAGELDRERLVQQVTDAGVGLTGAEFGAFFYNVLTTNGGNLMLYALSGAERHQFDAFGMPRATAVFHPTFVGEGVVRSDDIQRDHRYGLSAPHHGMPEGHLPVRSYLAAPVVSRSGEALGGLFFGHGAPGRFTERHERLVTVLAAQAAIAIDNARLFEAVQRANETLEGRVAERTAELTQAHEALRQAQKMEAVGQLTGGIAHDFNNLLTGIIGSLDIVERRIAAGRTAEAGRFIEAAVTSANRAASLTHRLLAFSRRQPLDPRPVDANRLVGSMEELLRRTLGESIEMEIVEGPGLWLTRCDPHQLESAVLNLAINARDAMPDGGRLRIETANATRRRGEGALEVQPGDYVRISVTDTGTGMDRETIERVFEPFFTTKPIGQGTGLGLSMVYGFARQSEGRAEIRSEPGQGTTVEIILPRHEGEDDRGEVAEAAAAPARRGQGEVVLVVEDEPAVRDLVIEVLGELGYRALEAEDGPSGLDIVEGDGPIDLLVTDIGLPGLNGRQLAEAARIARPGLKVLFMTGYADSAALSTGFLEPGMEMVTKPFAIDALAGRIREMVSRGRA